MFWEEFAFFPMCFFVRTLWHPRRVTGGGDIKRKRALTLTDTNGKILGNDFGISGKVYLCLKNEAKIDRTLKKLKYNLVFYSVCTIFATSF